MAEISPLRRRMIEDIAKTMVANASPSRCEKIARAILKLLKEARPSPPWPPAATPDDAQSLD